MTATTPTNVSGPDKLSDTVRLRNEEGAESAPRPLQHGPQLEDDHFAKLARKRGAAQYIVPKQEQSADTSTVTSPRTFGSMAWVDRTLLQQTA